MSQRNDPPAPTTASPPPSDSAFAPSSQLGKMGDSQPGALDDIALPGPLQPGQVIDGFELQERMHQGGMAAIWRVQRVVPQSDTDEMPLIMKVPRIKGGEDPTSIVGFEVERMIMPTLSGIHVPRYVAKGDFTRQPYIVMEHIPGPTLRERLDDTPLPPEEVARIGAQVALALDDLHRQQVVHLDIKPSNILFRPSGEAVLVDFGLSRHEHLPDLLEEEFSLPMGTGPYISPEQVQFVRNDPRSDLFALGVMLYYLATGERPFGNPGSVSGLRRRLYIDPLPPRAINEAVPWWLQEIILHCLEIKPEERYQSAAQLALDLQHPEQVTLTKRAERIRSSGGVKKLKRWFFSLGSEPAHASPSEQVERNPIIMVAVDTEGEAELLRQLRGTVRRIMQMEPGARLACVTVMRTARIGMDQLTDKAGHSLHVKKLVELKYWAHSLAQKLKLEDNRLTFHVLEAHDAANAIIEFASKNRVDHIVMGARGKSALRRYLGSVSSHVVAQADCSVTVVRAR